MTVPIILLIVTIIVMVIAITVIVHAEEGKTIIITCLLLILYSGWAMIKSSKYAPVSRPILISIDSEYCDGVDLPKEPIAPDDSIKGWIDSNRILHIEFYNNQANGQEKSN